MPNGQTVEQIRRAIGAHDVDRLLSLAGEVGPDELDEAIEEYSKYYERECLIARGIQDILAECRIRRTKKKIPLEGTHTYVLE